MAIIDKGSFSEWPRVRQSKGQATQLKLFPAKQPLESIAIDILGFLPEASDGFKHVLVICDKFSRVNRAVLLRKITALNISRAFLMHWAFSYGIPESLYQYVCTELGI